MEEITQQIDHILTGLRYKTITSTQDMIDALLDLRLLSAPIVASDVTTLKKYEGEMAG